MNSEVTTTGRGAPPQKWPFFSTLKVGFFETVRDVKKHSALRTAASRAGRELKRKFSVRKEFVDDVEVLRVYRTK